MAKMTGYLFYTEGYSEYNFVKHFFYYKNFHFTKDFNEIIKGNKYFLKNCKGDSNIFKSLKNDQWWIKELGDILIIIVADTDNSPCFSKYKENIKDNFNELEINKKLKIINSKPDIEQVYLEDIKLLKKVIIAYHNQKSDLHIRKFSKLQDSNLLTNDCSDRHVIKKILHSNNIAMSKKNFSDKFFGNAFYKKRSISICQRINSIFNF